MRWSLVDVALRVADGAVVALVQTDEDAPMNGGEMEQMTEAEVASPDLQVIGTGTNPP